MVTEIKEKEIMTLRELNLQDPDSNMCYVIYISDSKEELYKYPSPLRGKKTPQEIRGSFFAIGFACKSNRIPLLFASQCGIIAELKAV